MIVRFQSSLLSRLSYITVSRLRCDTKGFTTTSYPTRSRRNNTTMNLFTGSEHAQSYAQYRPTYPEAVTQEIIDYCKQSGTGFDMAIDVACGSGQSTFPLVKHFKNVMGVDVSQAQIESIPPVDNITFHVGRAEELDFVSSDSVDLITCAQGAHWLDRPKFYNEAQRILKENGVICFYGYSNVKLDNPEASGIFLKYKTEDLRAWWDEGRKHVDNMYADIELPFRDFHRLNDKHVIERKMPLSSFIGYLTSASSYRSLIKAHPDSKLLENLAKRLEEIYSRSQSGGMEEIIVTATWPVYMLLARK